MSNSLYIFTTIDGKYALPYELILKCGYLCDTVKSGSSVINITTHDLLLLHVIWLIESYPNPENTNIRPQNFCSISQMISQLSVNFGFGVDELGQFDDVFNEFMGLSDDSDVEHLTELVNNLNTK